MADQVDNLYNTAAWLIGPPKSRPVADTNKSLLPSNAGGFSFAFCHAPGPADLGANPFCRATLVRQAHGLVVPNHADSYGCNCGFRRFARPRGRGGLWE